MENVILDDVINEYLKINSFYNKNRNWKYKSEEELWNELCLCILSSRVPFELAESAFLHLLKNGFLKLDWISTFSKSQEQIAEELSKPLYLPRKLDGSCRKYRFPNIRAINIVKAARTISSEEQWFLNLLLLSPSEEEAREFLVARVSGIGLKEASHFLRNIGYSSRLAIIDSHIVEFLRQVMQFPNVKSKTITRHVYLELESHLQNICDNFNLDISIFDMAIWHCMRREQV